MNYSKEIGRISDQICYNLLYAPDYPQEDGTSLGQEEQQIQQWLTELTDVVRRENIRDWLRLGSIAITTAFDRFRNNHNGEARTDIEKSLEYLKKALNNEVHRTDFIGGPDGTQSIGN